MFLCYREVEISTYTKTVYNNVRFRT